MVSTLTHTLQYPDDADEQTINVNRYVVSSSRASMATGLITEPYSAAFVNTLVGILPDNVRSHLSKRCTAVHGVSDGSYRACLRFADDSTHGADVVIGADGIKSAVRGAVTGVDPSDAVTFSQCSCYRGLAPTEAVKAAGVKTDLIRRPILFTGEGKVSATIRYNQCARVYQFWSALDSVRYQRWEAGMTVSIHVVHPYSILMTS